MSAGPASTISGRKALEAALGDQVKTTYVENVPEEGRGRRAGDPQARATDGNTPDLHHLVRLHEPDREGGHAVPEGEVRALHRLQAPPNLSTYSSRFHEGRSVEGMIAGLHD